MSYVIRMPHAIPGGQCWYDGSGRTCNLMKAAEFMSKSVVEKKISELRRDYPDVEFVIDPAPEGLIGKKFGKE